MPSIHDAETVIRRCVQLGDGGARARASTSSAPRRTPTGSARSCPRCAALCDTDARQVPLLRDRRARLPVAPAAGRKTFVVAGCEAHVCVMQTVAGLLDTGHAVKWVADAVGSRHPHNRARGHRARAPDGRRHRDDRDGDLRMARDQRASEVQADAAAGALRRAASRTSAAGRDDDPAAHAARPSAPRPSRSRRSSGTSSVIASSARRIEVAGEPLPGRRGAARSAPSRCRCRRASRRAG